MDDLISRQEVLTFIEKSVSEYGDRYSVDMLNMWGLFAQVVKDMPPAQRWIPCTERMPEEYEEVWVTLRGSDMIVCKAGETLAEAAERVWKENIRVSICYYGSDGWYSIDGYPSMISPVAWMPINEPEPYKGEDE